MDNVNTAAGVHKQAVPAQDTNGHGKYVLEKAIERIEMQKSESWSSKRQPKTVQT